MKLRQSSDTLDLDLFIWLSNFFRGPNKINCYTSQRYGISTFRLSDYWVELGKKEILIEILKNKDKGIKSLSIEEAAIKLAVLEYAQSTVLILYNFDTSQLGRILDRLPGIKPEIFSKDLVFIPASSKEMADKIKARIPEEMAYSLVVDGGIGYL